MNSMSTSSPGPGITLRQAALIAGVGGLIMGFAAPFAEFYVYPRLVIAGNVAQTVQNIAAGSGLFLAAILAYLVTFICDVIVAWALYVLFIPVNRFLSLLTAWFRLVYTVIAFVALFKLVTVFRLLTSADPAAVLGSDDLQALVYLLLQSFRYEWSFSLVLFGIHIGLLGYLVYRSGYVPRLLGVLLLIAGAGYSAYYLSPYLLPGVNVDWIMITFVAELIFMLWLLIRGWKITVG